MSGRGAVRVVLVAARGVVTGLIWAMMGAAAPFVTVAAFLVPVQKFLTSRIGGV